MASSIYTISLFLIILSFVLSFRVSSLSVHRKNSPAHKLMKEKHERWISEHGRKYKDEAEKERRFKIFKENVERIEAFNRNETKGMKLGVNHFADLTDEEFRSSVRSTGYNRSLEISSSKSSSVKTNFFGDYGRRPSYGSFMYANVENVPESVDWRYKGAVTPVKQQGECGCCYTFSSIAAVEGINAIKRGQLISLSEQELVDCDHSNHQCSGGFMTHSFNFIEQNGITTEQNYPYRDNPGYFCLPAANMPVVRINGYQKVPANSEADMLKVVANQPLSIAISSDDYVFRFYKSGVLTEPCSTNLNHAVTIVGYGVANNGLKYWIIKNSWGTNWGEGGFGYLLRDSEDPAGICGIAMHPSFPII